jgi:hypothetical protein
MPTITLDGTGVSKSALVEGAYEFCGLNGQEYERTPEEMTAGLKKLNALMALLAKKGIDLGFDFPTYGNGLLEEPSGIPDDAQEPIMALLAQRLAPTIGGALSDDAKAILSTAVGDLYTNYAVAPISRTPATLLPSSGVRHGFFSRIISLFEAEVPSTSTPPPPPPPPPPPSGAALKFNVASNSQYLPLLAC